MEFTEGVRFDSLHLSPEIIRAIEKRNIEVSTPVQAGCIPPMMDWQGCDRQGPHRHRQDLCLRHPHRGACRPGRTRASRR